MAIFKFETKTKFDVEKKPRVYFTCHPDDFDKFFEKIRDDIFKTHDCLIYYTEDMSEEIAEDEKEIDIGRSNLIVVPVTFKLLSDYNRAMSSDIPYALKEHIPVLPIMMESGLDALYSKSDKFGEIQYLNPNSHDFTEISYEEKLKKFLEVVLVSDEMARRIRAAFDAYIFLSYRKRDRKYANELMRLIHSIPECRDIAIWFDEFLDPGESFKESIDRIMHDSKLFALLVTPNLLEEPDGKPNFVMSEEYPAALDSGIDILPTEMVETDKDMLKEKFRDIPDCIRPSDSDFDALFVESVMKTAIESNNTPEHNFLIGLAYLDGIDVEVNRVLACELISGAAEAGLLEAMEKLYEMYNEGVGVNVDYRSALKWAEKIYTVKCEALGEEHSETLESLNNMALLYSAVGNYTKALELSEKAYALLCRKNGQEHSDSLAVLCNLATDYTNLGNYPKALELMLKVYDAMCRTLGEEYPDTITALNNLGMIYSCLGDYDAALESGEKAYSLRFKILGKEHPDTLTSLNNLAGVYQELGDYQRALELYTQAYDSHVCIFGEDHPETLENAGNMSLVYSSLGEYYKALEIIEKVYNTMCRVLGKDHPITVSSLVNLAGIYYDIDDYQKSSALLDQAYNTYCRILGEDHPDTLTALNNLGEVYNCLGEYKLSLELMQKAYDMRCEVLGQEHPDTLMTLNNLAAVYNSLGDFDRACELTEKAYRLLLEVFGEDHPHVLAMLGNMAMTYLGSGQFHKALSSLEKLYELQCRFLGEEHPETMTTFEIFIDVSAEIGDYKRALFYCEKVYELLKMKYGTNFVHTMKALMKLEEVRSKIN